jgi:hypothetical protein
MKKSRILVLAILVLALLVPALAQDFRANLYSFYGQPCVAQSEHFSPRFHIGYNTQGFSQLDLDRDCGDTAVPRKTIRRAHRRADAIWNNLFGDVAPLSYHQAIASAPFSIDYGTAFDAAWEQALAHESMCFGNIVYNVVPPHHVVLQPTEWQDENGIFHSQEVNALKQIGLIWLTVIYVNPGDGSIEYAVNPNDPSNGGGTLALRAFEGFIAYNMTGNPQDCQ